MEDYSARILRLVKLGKNRLKPSRLSACLQCKLNGLSCSLEWLGSETAPRCARCIRNATEFCIQQIESFPLMKHTGEGAAEPVPNRAWLTTVQMQSVVKLRLPGREAAVTLFVREPGIRAKELQDMALELVSGDKKTFFSVVGVPLTVLDRQTLPLPVFHENDKWSGHRGSLPKPKDWRDFFRHKRERIAERRRIIDETDQLWQAGNPYNALHAKLVDAARELLRP